MTRRDWAFMVALVLTVVGSALIVVKTKHENRTLVHQLEQLRAEKARLETEWAQLQLEGARHHRAGAHHQHPHHRKAAPGRHFPAGPPLALG